MLSTKRKVLVLIFLSIFIILGAGYYYRLFPFDSLKPYVKVDVVAINTTEQWDDHITIARERDKQYCSLSYPHLDSAMDPQTVPVVFMNKAFKMTLFKSADIVCHSIISTGSWESDYTARAVNLLLELRKRDRENNGAPVQKVA